MIVADTEEHAHGHRWFLIDLETGERVCTGQQTYVYPDQALTVGEVVMVAARNAPTTDLTEGQDL